MRRINYLLYIVLLLSACRGAEVLIPSEQEQRGEQLKSLYEGFYVLNEGNMGSNKATLDFYSFAQATYTRNIYGAANPEMVQSLGDVGNDLKVYGGRLYAVINCSNMVEVMDAYTCKHITSINCPNCRSLYFEDGYGYVSSYAGPVQIGAEHAQIGYVAKFDTATAQLIDTCYVGYQPEDIVGHEGLLYVANSGGYLVPNYEHTVSVVDMERFEEIGRIEVANNLHHLLKDGYGQLWVSSRGDYYQQPSRLYCVDMLSRQLADSVAIAVSGMWLDGDSLYVYGSEWSYVSMSQRLTYHIVDVRTHEVVNEAWLTDGSVEMKAPYGLMVNPITKDIYLTDAKDYVTPGTLWCIGERGQAKWSVRTGDVPAHMCLLKKRKE